MYKYLTVFALLAAAVAPTHFASADGCGDIITSTTTIEITDCNNPFGASTESSPFTLRIEGEVVSNNSEISIIKYGINSYEIESAQGVFGSEHTFYLHDGDNYREVNTTPSSPTEYDYERLVGDYFSTYLPDNPHGDLYVQYLLGNPEVENDPNWDWDIFYTVESYVNVNYISVIPILMPGTYTLVSKDIHIYFVDSNNQKHSFWRELLETIIPTAHAQYIFPPDPIYTLTFTLSPKEEAPTGASSVLFLPGIMGSRLFEESGECGSSIEEQERWFSFSECDQLRLETNVLGNSINNLYTKEGSDSIAASVAIKKLYKTFLSTLEEWKDTGVINDFTAVPYDWRLSLEDIVKSKKDNSTGIIVHDPSIELSESYLYGVVAKLASGSKSGKVTLVTHSNGGLVAKRFLSDLDAANDPLLQKIDNLIMVGVPQVGTPDAVASILHGTEIDFVMDQKTTRQLVNNMAFSHHLLPTEQYFSSVSTPVINFLPGGSTDSWIESFGKEITDVDTLHAFMSKDSGRPKPSNDDLSTPQVVDNFLLDYAKTEGSVQANWLPPAEMKVYQVAGTGLDTLSQIEYFTDRECVSRSFFQCTEYGPKLGYRVTGTIDGDGTVVVPSALAMSDNNDSVERLWLNLLTYNNDGFLGSANSDRQHKDLFEIDNINTLVGKIVNNDTDLNSDYISYTAPVFNKGERLVFQLHSPLDMRLTVDGGGELSSTTNTVREAVYHRYGELQYISVPRNNDITLYLDGVSYGSFTLDIEEMNDGVLAQRQTYPAIPSTASSKVILQINQEQTIDDAKLEVDYEGDGTTDVVYSEGEGGGEDIVTYDNLYQAINALGLNKKQTSLLVKKAKLAQKLSERIRFKKVSKKLEKFELRVLIQQLKWLEKKGLISKSERGEIEKIIANLLDL